jgi:arylsulfatase A-like enzyme
VSSSFLASVIASRWLRALRALQALCALGALAVPCACLPRACGTPLRERGDTLVDRIPVAQKSWDGILVEPGSPEALPLLEEGWSYGETAPDGNTFRWAVSETASFRFTSPREGLFLSWIECEPFRFPGSPAQKVGLTVNGTELDPLELRPGRNRYAVQVPVRSGANEVRLRFRYAGEPTRAGADKRRLAVALYRFEVPFRDWSSRTGPFARVDSGGASGVFLPAGGRLAFFVDVHGKWKLRLRMGTDAQPTLRAPPGAAVVASLRSDAKVIWSETFESSRGGEESWERDLPPTPGSPLELSFQASNESVLVQPELVEAGGTPNRNSAPAPASASAARIPFDRPDIVVVVLDGASALRMGLYGNEEEPSPTPVLDSLVRESVVFDRAVSQAVYTIASVGSLLTGQYPERHQSVSFADRLRDDVVTFPGVLEKAGYRTVGFAGNAVVSKIFGLDRGYGEFFPVWEDEGYSGHGDSVVRSFRKWMGGLPGGPFLAYIHFREPHFPYNPPPPFDTRYGPGLLYPDGIRDAAVVDALNGASLSGHPPEPEVLSRIRGLYDGNLAYADSLVGEIVQILDARGRARPTILVVTADHGEALFQHGFLGHNTQLYEESIRVPLLVRAPGLSPRRVPDLVELIDLTPTILELAGLAGDPALAGMQGKSLVPYLLGVEGADSKTDRIAFSRTVWDKPRYSARDRRFKLIWDSRTGASELYDLESDPGESNDLAVGGAGPLLEEGYLRQELFRWYREQERLRSGESPPAGAILSEEDERRINSLGYADQMGSRGSPKEK